MMALEGYATPQGTRRYCDRMVAGGMTHRSHFSEGPTGLLLSTIGMGTYLGGNDAGTDALYLEAVRQAVGRGCNVLDSAINYRCQRSERVIGRALAELIKENASAREELLVATKGGFIPYDGGPPRDAYAYILETFVNPGVINYHDVVADCHCMAPAYLRHQLDASLTNLGLSTIDVYYLHNPETQLDQVTREEFLSRMR
ncbi:MAG: aldo/keto reductase, partial [Nitrospiraceae bacterium]